MINVYDESIEWTKRANDEMSLRTMIDELLSICGVSETFFKFEPRIDSVKGTKEDFLYFTLYRRHHELLNDIVEIFFPNLLFVPSQINKKRSSEFFLFTVINHIYDITWYQEIEKSRPRGYERENAKLDKALKIVGGYADYSKVGKLIHFPTHQNETILNLSEILKRYRPRQEKKVIKCIKEYFKIKSLQDTKQIKIKKGNRKMNEVLKELGYRFETNDNPTDDEVRELYKKYDEDKS